MPRRVFEIRLERGTCGRFVGRRRGRPEHADIFDRARLVGTFPPDAFVAVEQVAGRAQRRDVERLPHDDHIELAGIKILDAVGDRPDGQCRNVDRANHAIGERNR
jgi:hypothetical protein